MSDAPPRPLPVDVRKEDAARLVREWRSAPAEPPLGPVQPAADAVSHAMQLLSSPNQNDWGTGLEICMQCVGDSMMDKEKSRLAAQDLAPAVPTRRFFDLWLSLLGCCTAGSHWQASS